MRARKLQSGSWRVRTSINGERRSFTAETKKQAEFMAHQYVVGVKRERNNRTVKKAVTSYIDDREPVLSPSTLYGYRSLARTAYAAIDDVRVDDLDSQIVQRWVSEYAREHSPKRVRNAYGLLLAALGAFRPDFKPSVRLPQARPSDAHTPAAEDVVRLLEYIKGRDAELYAAVLLGAFVPMRRGEVCGLLGGDVDHKRGTVTVRHNLVQGEGGAYYDKPPKTAAGHRVVTLPASVMAQLPVVGREERVVSLPPHVVSQRFKTACRACGLEGVHFHSLRHFGASVLHAWGVPDAYIMARGGWSTAEVMRRVYREALDDETRRVSEAVGARIDEMVGG